VVKRNQCCLHKKYASTWNREGNETQMVSYICYSDKHVPLVYMQPQSHTHNTSHILTTPVTCLWLQSQMITLICNSSHIHKSDNSHKCVTAVPICAPSHMLTLCAWNCTFSITYNVIACQASTRLTTTLVVFKRLKQKAPSQISLNIRSFRLRITSLVCTILLLYMHRWCLPLSNRDQSSPCCVST
jgi:hypothetical protein